MNVLIKYIASFFRKHKLAFVAGMCFCFACIYWITYFDIKNCICSSLTTTSQTFRIDNRLREVCDTDHLSSDAFSLVITECRHGQRLQLMIAANEGTYTGRLLDK